MTSRRAGLFQAFSAMAIFLCLQISAKADPRIDAETGPARDEQLLPPGALVDGIIEQQGVASWYGRHWRGRKTANGSRFDERSLTAASRSLPLATRARVVNLENGRSIDVLVNDRGPYVDGRIMDLSQRAAAALGMTRTGLAQVAIRVQLAPAS